MQPSVVDAAKEMQRVLLALVFYMPVHACKQPAYRFLYACTVVTAERRCGRSENVNQTTREPRSYMTQAVRKHRTLTHRNVDRRFADSAESEISFRLFYTRQGTRYFLSIRHSQGILFIMSISYIIYPYVDIKKCTIAFEWCPITLLYIYSIACRDDIFNLIVWRKIRSEYLARMLLQIKRERISSDSGVDRDRISRTSQRDRKRRLKIFTRMSGRITARKDRSFSSIWDRYIRCESLLRLTSFDWSFYLQVTVYSTQCGSTLIYRWYYRLTETSSEKKQRGSGTRERACKKRKRKGENSERWRRENVILRKFTQVSKKLHFEKLTNKALN